MNPIIDRIKNLGIPGIPPSIDILLEGSIYAAILDSVPVHLGIIIQALKSNISAGNTCVFVTQLNPAEFLSAAETRGIDFSNDIVHNRLYLFTQEGNYRTNIFRHGISRFLQEFEHFQIPKGSFYLFDQAEALFTMSDQNMAKAQAADYRDWAKSQENTSLFLFLAQHEKISPSIVECLNGMIHIGQNKTDIELLVDFWYSQEGVIAAKAFPISLDANGMIKALPALPHAARDNFSSDSHSDDIDSIYYYGPDLETFSTSLQHPGIWIQAQSYVDLIHLSRDAVQATIVISLDSHSDLQHAAKIVHYLRLNRGNKLRIVLRESDFTIRYSNELLLLRFGANLIIHKEVAKQQLQLLWEMLAGQTYTRNIAKNFDLSHSSILPSSYKGYIDLVTFCNETLGLFEKGGILNIPLLLIVASYHDNASPPAILKQIKIERNGDYFSSDAAHCYLFIHACAEENASAAIARITAEKQSSMFKEIRFITEKGHIQETLQRLVESGNIAFAPDFSEAIAQTKHTEKVIATNETVTASPPSLDPHPGSHKKPDFQAHEVVAIGEKLAAGMTANTESSSIGPSADMKVKHRNYSNMIHRSTTRSLSESIRWPQK